jgi:16S rRNA (uracil1498-N3)-methyltransferase
VRHYLIDCLPGLGQSAVLSKQELAHLTVTRPVVGEQFVLTDQQGAQATFSLVDLNAGSVRQETASVLAPHSPDLHLILAVVKGPAMDLAIRMATECGATHIHPTVMTRSIAKGDRADRWERIATSAAKQCQRARPPVILPLSTLQVIATRIPDARYIALPNADSTPAALSQAQALFIGPEGGFTAQEISTAKKLGFLPISLARHVLRTPTAVAAGLSRLGLAATCKHE